jgi:serine/threonine protein phosphatase PrpC
MNKLFVKAAGFTDQGKTRQNNEDAVWVDASRGLLIVADGMGGHQAGEVASAMAINTIPSTLDQLIKSGTTGEIADPSFSQETNRLRFCLKMANQTIFEAATRYPQDFGMGTTCTAALIVDGRLSIAHVGDSRCYLIRPGQIQQLTQDHSLVMEQVRQGLISKDDEAVQTHQNILTRSLGTQPEVQIDVDEHPLMPGDIIVLCSDGLDKELREDQVRRTAEQIREPVQLAKRLIEMANEAGGRDNITVAVARIDQSGLLAWIKGLFQ